MVGITSDAVRLGYTVLPCAESVVTTNLRFRRHSRLSSRISRCTRLRLTTQPERRNSAVIRRLPYVGHSSATPCLWSRSFTDSALGAAAAR
jgi:hypothetical protein